MKSKKSIYLVLILFIGFNFNNCVSSDDYDCTCGPTAEYFDINGLTFSQSKFNADTNQYEILNTDDVIPFSEYAFINLEFLVDYIANVNSEKDKFNFSFSTIATAYACSCPERGYYGAKFEGITNLNITTLHDYNDNYKANDNINDLLSFSEYFNFFTSQSHEEFIAMNSDNVLFRNNFIKPTEAPTSGAILEFKIVIELSNGETYEAITPKITIE